MSELILRDVRNIRELELSPSPGLNLFVGANAQGKTSLLESVGLLARGRSFRTEETRAMIRLGASGLTVRAQSQAPAGPTSLEVELDADSRRLRVDGRPVQSREYNGRLEVAVYSTERLKAVRGAQRDRRQFLDRGAAALWPSYRQLLRDFERSLAQRNAALAAGSRDQPSWNEAFAGLGAELRRRRCGYAARLSQALQQGFRPRDERYQVQLSPDAAQASQADAKAALLRELEARRRDEQRLRRSLAGPQRDAVQMLVDGQDASASSSGQARSFLLALTLAALDVYQQERGAQAVALLDDLDSELDDARSADLLAEVARRGQAFVTTAHPAWAAGLAGPARRFLVNAGRVQEA